MDSWWNQPLPCPCEMNVLWTLKTPRYTTVTRLCFKSFVNEACFLWVQELAFTEKMPMLSKTFKLEWMNVFIVTLQMLNNCFLTLAISCNLIGIQDPVHDWTVTFFHVWKPCLQLILPKKQHWTQGYFEVPKKWPALFLNLLPLPLPCPVFPSPKNKRLQGWRIPDKSLSPEALPVSRTRKRP